MKLKRFLLKYEPPGIGLEIEDASGGTDVRHKALPSLEGVDDHAIGNLVDGLLRGEPELLNGKRHAAALTSLLSRLYQVDICPAEDTKSPVLPAVTSPMAAGSALPVSAGGPTPTGSAGAVPASGGDTEPHWKPHEGMRAVLLGLQGELAFLNGQEATLTKVRLQGEKCEVMVHDPPEQPKILKVKGFDRILPLGPSGSLVPGARVVARGLRQDVELNGTLGRVVNASADGQRIEVQPLVGSQLLSMRPGNLTIIDVPPGHPAEELWFRAGSAKARPSSKSSGSRKVPAMPSLAKPNIASDPMANPSPRKDKKAARAAAGLSQQASEAKASSGVIGAVVELCGLTSNATFNGLRAEVLSVSPDGSTFEIRMDDGSKKKLRAENARFVDESGGTLEPGRGGKLVSAGNGSDESMQPIDVGVVVRLTGLRSAAHLNGERAVVVRDIGTHVEIRMLDGSAKRVKKPNVRVVGVAERNPE